MAWTHLLADDRASLSPDDLALGELSAEEKDRDAQSSPRLLPDVLYRIRFGTRACPLSLPESFSRLLCGAFGLSSRLAHEKAAPLRFGKANVSDRSLCQVLTRIKKSLPFLTAGSFLFLFGSAIGGKRVGEVDGHAVDSGVVDRLHDLTIGDSPGTHVKSSLVPFGHV